MAKKKPHHQGPWAHCVSRKLYCYLADEGREDAAPFLHGIALCGRRYTGSFTWAGDVPWYSACPDCAATIRGDAERRVARL